MPRAAAVPCPHTHSRPPARPPAQTSTFLSALRPPHVVLVHGEATEMARLKKALEQQAAAESVPRTVYMPKVTQPVLIAHKAQRAAKVVGRLAEKPPQAGQALQGLLVTHGGSHTVMHPEDLSRFTKLQTGRIVQRQAMALHRPFSEVRRAAEGGGAGWRAPCPAPPSLPAWAGRCSPLGLRWNSGPARALPLPCRSDLPWR